MEQYRGTRDHIYMRDRFYAKMEIAMGYTEIEKWDLPNVKCKYQF